MGGETLNYQGNGGGGTFNYQDARQGGYMYMFTAELCSWSHFSLADILVLAGTAGPGGMVPYARILCPPPSILLSSRILFLCLMPGFLFM